MSIKYMDKTVFRIPLARRNTVTVFRIPLAGRNAVTGVL